MVFQIKLADKIYTVHTDVGDGLTRVILDEECLDDESIDSLGDEECQQSSTS